MQFITVTKKTIIQPSYFQKTHFQLTNCSSIHRQPQFGKPVFASFKQSLGQQLIRFTLIVLLTPFAILPVMAADIEATNTNTAVNIGANDVLVIDIATPDAARVSYNSYQQFNVGEQGAVLNNSIAPRTETTLAGSIAHNPNLTGGAAKLIINEVVSNNPSVLNGALEVAGQAAQVIVANADGITCDGCGFINTPEVVLTTGNPHTIIDGASFWGDIIFVNGNQPHPHEAITIRGKGITGPYLKLIARTINIDGPLSAQHVALHVKSRAADSRPVPAIAIDVSVLGGMHADSITLISNDVGAGINVENTLHAIGDNIELTAKGNITIKHANLEGRAIELSSEDKVSIDNAILKADILGINAENNLTLKETNSDVSNVLLLNSENTISMDKTTLKAANYLGITAEKKIALTETNLAGTDTQLISNGTISMDKATLKVDTAKLTIFSAGETTMKETNISEPVPDSV